jgi:hypothetical protein
VLPLPFGVRRGDLPNIADLAVFVKHLRPGGLATFAAAARRQDDERQTKRIDPASCMVRSDSKKSATFSNGSAG